MRKLLGLLLFAASPAFGVVYHVNKSITCSDAGACSLASPCCTIQGGINKVTTGSGDDVTVDDAATYNECVKILKSGASQADPLTLDLGTSTMNGNGAWCANNISGPCNPGSAGGSATIVTNDTYSFKSFIRIKNGNIVPTVASTKHWGIYEGCSNYVEIDGVDFVSIPNGPFQGANGPSGIIGFYGESGADGHDLMIKNVTATPPSTALGWHFVGGGEQEGVTLYRNTVSNLQGALWCVSGGAGKAEITNNEVSGMGSDCDGPGGGNLIQAYNQGALGIRRNLFNANARYLTSLRTLSSTHPTMIFEGNTVVGTGSNVAINAGYDSNPAPSGPKALVARNNLFKSLGTAFEIQNGRSGGSMFETCSLFIESNNAFYSVVTRISDTNSTCTYSPTGDGTDTTPGANPINGSFCPVATTPSIIDTGLASYPVPSGGGGTVDRGACESGTAGGAWNTTYTFQAEDTTSDTTPALSWSGSSTGAVDFAELDFVTAGVGSGTPTKYRCQVDSTLSFDSGGIMKAYWDSGDVSPYAATATVTTALADGSWYARCRLNDGPWSAALPFTEGVGGSICGNGIIESGEACDGAALGGETCVSLGLASGTLVCTACNFNTSACVPIVDPPTGTTRIDYLDVVSAPVGGYVTLNGKRFGVPTGTVKFGTISATVFSWSDTRVVVTVPSSAGATVTLTTASLVASNSTPFQLHAGTLRYVAKTGTDSGTCASSGSPCLTINYCKTQASAGDVCLIRVGTYVEDSGAGAGLYIRTTNSGTPSQPITYRGYPGENVIVDCGGVCGGATIYVDGSDIQVANLKSTGARGFGVALYGARPRVADVEAYGNNLFGYASTSGGDFNAQSSASDAKLLGCIAHDSGSVDNLDHGFYMKGTPNMEIGWSRSYDHTLGYGLQLYGGAGTFAGAVVHDSIFYGNRNGGITVNDGSIGASVYNNRIYGNGKHGLIVAGGVNPPTNSVIVNNAIAANNTIGGFAEVRINTGSGLVFKNNIVAPTGTLAVRHDATATGSTFDRNLYGTVSATFEFSSSTQDFASWKAGGRDTNGAAGNPLFFSATDLHITFGSPASGIGDSAVEPALDADSYARSTHDAGAYVPSAAPPSTAVPTLRGVKIQGAKTQ